MFEVSEDFAVRGELALRLGDVHRPDCTGALNHEKCRPCDVEGVEPKAVPHPVRLCRVAAVVHEHRVIHLVFIDELADAFAPLRQDQDEAAAASGVFGGMLLKLAEPAAAVRSPGAAIEHQQHAGRPVARIGRNVALAA